MYSLWTRASEGGTPFFAHPIIIPTILHFAGYFPGMWSFKWVKIGTPGKFPDGADYSTGYQGKGHANVIGYATWWAKDNWNINQ